MLAVEGLLKATFWVKIKTNSTPNCQKGSKPNLLGLVRLGDQMTWPNLSNTIFIKDQSQN